MNYESELYDLIINNLKERYSIENEDTLLRYLFLRFKIDNFFDKELTDNKYEFKTKLRDFIIEELNFPNEIVYKGEKINKGYSLENSFINIIDNIILSFEIRKIQSIYNVELTNKDLFELEWQKVKMFLMSIKPKFKDKKYNEAYIKYEGLKFINKLYNAKISPYKIIEYIDYPTEHNFFKRTLEEKYEALVRDGYIVEKTNVNLIKEEDVENYFVKNIESIEEGLRVLARQYPVKDGYIDILAQDKEGNYVIIEIKREINKEIVWQILHYDKEIRKIKNTNNVRIIVIANKYKKSILNILKNFSNIEYYKYNFRTNFGELKHMKIEEYIA